MGRKSGHRDTISQVGRSDFFFRNHGIELKKGLGWQFQEILVGSVGLGEPQYLFSLAESG